ncbi:glycosyltransferase family 2 protein, partial [Staphylococcus arlettae]|uniref:glycosyltransferase family 2 protein n=1 Tax=Staphylococcus arlettae TaxID=29378 RepID=UPI003464E19B
DVTVIISTYNRLNKLIKRVVKFILIQTTQNFEVLIKDDNKDTETSENVKSLISSFHDKRIKYLKNEVNMGGAKSRNEGITYATGRHLSFLGEYFTIAIAHNGNRISSSTKRQEQLQKLLEYKLTKLKDLKLADKRILYRHFLASTSNYLTQNKRKAAIMTAIKAFYCKPVVFLYDVFKIIAIKINNKGVELNELK